MSGQWRITVDSWITPDATWYGRRSFVLSGSDTHSLVAALQAVIDGDVRDQLGHHRFSSELGAAPPADFPADPKVIEAVLGDGDRDE